MKLMKENVEIWGIDMSWVYFELPESDLSVAKTKQMLEGPKVDEVSTFEYPCSRFDLKQHDTEASLTKKVSKGLGNTFV